MTLELEQTVDTEQIGHDAIDCAVDLIGLAIPGRRATGDAQLMAMQLNDGFLDPVRALPAKARRLTRQGIVHEDPCRRSRGLGTTAF